MAAMAVDLIHRLGLDQYLDQSSLDGKLVDLIKLRASQTHTALTELADMPLAMATTNAWNRLAISARTCRPRRRPVEKTG